MTGGLVAEGRFGGGGPVADGIVELEAEGIGIFGYILAVNDPRVGAEIAAEGAKEKMLIGPPEFFAGDASAVGADVDGLSHFELVAVGKRETHEHALGDALFGTVPLRGGGQGCAIQSKSPAA